MLLKHKTILITGSTRGIGRAIALRFAKEGANIVITGKTSTPHVSLPGTIHSVADEVEALGGHALPIELDLRDTDAIQSTVENTISTFGQLDVLVNNASALALIDTPNMTPKRFDLLMGVNVRGTFFMSQAALPHLSQSDNPHILNIAPPLNMDGKWFKDALVYAYSKYGMSICTLGLAEEFREKGIAVSSLWPKTTIATSAVEVNFPQFYAHSRKPEIMGDAALAIITKPSREVTGQFFVDEVVLRDAGIRDFDQYAINPGEPLQPDFFLETEGC